jgi:hypothetical protein
VDARVECYAGSRGAEEPRAIVFADGRRVEVAAILDRWRSPEHRGFRVRGGDGLVYRLEETHGDWTVAGVRG